MSQYSLSHLSDGALLRELTQLVARDRVTTAELLAHLAEVDERKLYVPAAYPSMYAYCVEELKLSEEAAFKRIHAARTARRFPAIFPALAEGRLNMTAVILLAPYLTPENAHEVLTAASFQSKARIGELLAERFPRPDIATRLVAIPGTAECLGAQRSTGNPEAPSEVVVPGRQHVPGRVEGAASPGQHAPERVGGEVRACQHAPERVGLGAPTSKLTPLAPGRYSLQLTIDQATRDKLQYALDLLSHQQPTGDLAAVLDRALDALLTKLERRKFAATPMPRRSSRQPKAGSRHIPAAVRRAVWERDGGRCTFVSDAGRRCAARARLEFDHVEPVARGGRTTVPGVRLRCRAHNQFAAECAFGAGFMSRKREQAGEAAALRTRSRATAQAAALGVRAASQLASAAVTEPAEAHAQAAGEVVPWLRELGFRADEACRGALECGVAPEAPLTERVHAALAYLGKTRGRRIAFDRPIEARQHARVG